MKSFWNRLFGKGASAPKAPPANDRDDDPLDAVRDQIRRDVAAGFDDPATIYESALAVFEGEIDPSVLEPAARRCLEEELASHAALQRGWPAPTDCERLDAAFAALEKQGVISRQNFSCCGTCGSTEIWDEIDAVEKAGGPALGYAFYHIQDTESAVEGYGLCLNYGACEEGEEPALAIGRRIVAELERHGLRTDWNGSWDKRIAVPMDWRRRRAI